MKAEMPPSVVIHGLEHAMQALAVAGPAAVTLLSAPAAAGFLGVAWWRALLTLVSAEHPGGLHELLDCDDAAGRAMEALRLGQRRLILGLACPQRDAVLDRAAGLDAVILPWRPPALDLGLRGSGRALGAWLAAGAERPVC